MNLVNQLPQMWASSFESKYEKVPGASWYLKSGRSSNDGPTVLGSFGYVKKGNNFDNYNKMMNVINDKIKKGQLKADPTLQYIVSSYVSPPLPGSQSQTYVVRNPQDMKKYGLTPPEMDDVYNSAKTAIGTMTKNLNAAALLSNNTKSLNELIKLLPTDDKTYNQIPTIGKELTNAIPQFNTTATYAKKMIKEPKSKVDFPPQIVTRLDFLFKNMS
jgi:hypothetical protein